MKPIRTVNVVEFSEDSAFQIKSLASYPDTKAGNKAAEKRMLALIKEANQGVQEINKEAVLDDGYFQDGDWCVIITHS